MQGGRFQFPAFRQKHKNTLVTIARWYIHLSIIHSVCLSACLSLSVYGIISLIARPVDTTDRAGLRYLVGLVSSQAVSSWPRSSSLLRGLAGLRCFECGEIPSFLFFSPSSARGLVLQHLSVSCEHSCHIRHSTIDSIVWSLLLLYGRGAPAISYVSPNMETNYALNFATQTGSLMAWVCDEKYHENKRSWYSINSGSFCRDPPVRPSEIF